MEKEEFRVYKDTRIFSKNGKLRCGALWEVSNLGNVRKNGKEYIPYENKGGYLTFGVHFFVHRAVAELFLERIDSKPTVDHIDRDKHNNHSSNLRWATPKEQAANRDNESISKSMIGNKRSLGKKSFLGRKHSEESKAKMRAAKLGNKYSLGRIPSEETRAKLRAAALGHITSEEAKAKMRAAALGKVYVINPSTEHITRIDPSELPDYLEKGYIRGMKIKK